MKLELSLHLMLYYVQTHLPFITKVVVIDGQLLKCLLLQNEQLPFFHYDVIWSTK